MNETDYFFIFKSMVRTDRKKILEIGGAVHPNLVSVANPSRWISIDIDKSRLSRSLASDCIPSWYNPLLMNASEMAFADSTFDLIYSTNCFEHVQDLSSLFAETYRVLREDGIFFTVFSPIWSGPVGHHTWVWDGDNPLTFNDNVFPDWYHLVCTPEELKYWLLKKYSPELAGSIIEYVYYSRDLNRLLDYQYEDLVKEQPFYSLLRIPIISMRKPSREMMINLRSRYPEVRNFCTLGYLLILAKKPHKLKQLMRIYVNGIMQILIRKTISLIG